MSRLVLSSLLLALAAGHEPAESPEILESCPEGPAAWEAVTLASGELAHRGDPATVAREGGGDGEAARTAHLALILDASGSMRAELPGAGKSRLAVAKEVMAKLVPGIPEEVTASLWAYGHRYPQKPKETSCRDMEQVIPPGPVDAAAYMERINAMQAIGYTPIADSIRQAARHLPEGRSNSIVLVSDGEETCGGDPCALAEALKASGASVTVHVVGYAVEEAERESLRCIARVSGGTYYDAEDPSALLEALQEATGAAYSETLLRVETVGPDGTEVRGDLVVTRSGAEGRPARYRTWTDNLVFPGTVDLVVHAIPKILYEGLPLEEGSRTTVRIPLGAVRVLSPERKGVRFDIHDAGAAKRIGQYSDTLVVAPGCYQVEVEGKGDIFTVDPGETEEIVLATIRVLDPGRKNARFDLHEPATSRWLGQDNGTLHLVPGRYQVGVVRKSEPFRLGSGETREIVLGAVRVEDPDGRDARFSLHDAGTGDWLCQSNGTLYVLPGRYRVAATATGKPFDVGPGDTETVRLGILQVPARFVLFDEGGRRIGRYEGPLPLLPGSYRVEVEGGPVFEKVEIEPGEVEAPR